MSFNFKIPISKIKDFLRFSNKIEKSLIIATFFSFLILFLRSTSVFAVTAADCLNKDVNNLSQGDQDWCLQVGFSQLIAPIQSANEKNKQNLYALQNQLNSISQKISLYATQLKKTQSDINQREEDMAYTREIFDQKVRDQYTFLRLYDPIAPFLFADSASQAFQEISLRQRAADADRASIGQYVQDLAKLNSDQDSLQKSENSLSAIQKTVSEKATFLAGEIAKADAYLATLSSKQQSFIAAKLASLGLSRSAYNLAGGCSSDINPFKSPGFSPAIGFFTFGVPNRVGMDQYGAWGRAKAGQSYDQILRAYYNFDSYQDYSGITIRVNDGNGINAGSVFWTGSLEDYVKRIYEVPDSWTDNDLAALKAQAIAARSYVLAATNNGANSVCANQYCQVFKTSPKGGNWESAVNATSGKVMVQGGSPIKAWFSATHGGYEYTSSDIGWSATSWTKRLVDASGSVNSFSDLMNNAYDKSSPVFYCDWGGRASYNGTAWLKPDEVADIANVTLLAERDGSTKPHLYQVDQTNPEGTDTWDASTVKSKLAALGGTPIDSATSVSVNVDFSTGRTTSVVINGQTINANDFKDYFNLRAPGNIQIVGPLFNVEQR